MKMHCGIIASDLFKGQCYSMKAINIKVIFPSLIDQNSKYVFNNFGAFKNSMKKFAIIPRTFCQIHKTF